MEVFDLILRVFGAAVIAGGGLSVIIYQVFKHLAAKWLDMKFDERLQSLKHEQGKEIGQLRYKISTMLDRATKLHQREYEVLPDAWATLTDAFWEVQRLVALFQTYPDLNRMSIPQLDEFLRESRLPEWQRDELRGAADKTQYYRMKIFYFNLDDANQKARLAYTYFKKNGIFISPDLGSKFEVIQDILWNALIQHQTNEEHDTLPRDMDHIKKMYQSGEGPKLLQELQQAVQTRLWST